MEKNQVIQAIQAAKQASNKKNFMQSVDFVIALKGVDVRKQDQQLDLFITLPYTRKKVSVCGLVAGELLDQSKGTFDETISQEEFPRYQDKKLIKKLANKHDFFVAQATIMPKVATAFGRVLGPRAKMPNPKIGCVVPPNANLKPLYERLQKIIRLQSKNSPVMQCSIGKEDSDESQMAENALAIYNSVMHALPNEAQNIKSVYVKLTMGNAIKLSSQEAKAEAKKKKSLFHKEAPKAAKPAEAPKPAEKISKENVSMEKKNNEKKEPKKENTPKKKDSKENKESAEKTE